MQAGPWWSDLERRLAGSGIELSSRLDARSMVPASLFDSAIENCLENARAKRAREPGIAISIAVSLGENGPELSICDNGSAIAESVVRDLFVAPIAKSRGENLGIGLFQAYRQARQAGWLLQLSGNVDGAVCFMLSRLPESSDIHSEASTSSSPSSQVG